MQQDQQSSYDQDITPLNQPPIPPADPPPARARSLEAANFVSGEEEPVTLPGLDPDDPPLSLEADADPSEPTADELDEQKHLRAFDDIYDWFRTMVVTCVSVLLAFLFVARMVTVFGTSMLPNLEDGDRLLCVTLFYTPKYGDIVAITKPNTREKNLIKRVVAAEGQTVDIDFSAGEVWVDGDLLREDFINGPTMLSYDQTFPVTVPEGCVFVMGDNRNGSWDSRDTEVGMIDTRYLMGTACIRVFPFDAIGYLNEPKVLAD